MEDAPVGTSPLVADCGRPVNITAALRTKRKTGGREHRSTRICGSAWGSVGRSSPCRPAPNRQLAPIDQGDAVRPTLVRRAPLTATVAAYSASRVDRLDVPDMLLRRAPLSPSLGTAAHCCRKCGRTQFIELWGAHWGRSQFSHLEHHERTQ